jgi:phage pi2 protein 07
MKTKELIRQLQEADPSGEIEVCVENEDIHFIEIAPAYWDGRLQVLVRDSNKKGYDVVGAKITSHGKKLKIRTLSIDDAIFNNPDLPVEIDVHNEGQRKHYKEEVKKWRLEAINILEQLLNHGNTPIDKKDFIFERIEAGKRKIKEEEKG